MLVILKAPGEQIAHKPDHFIIIAFHVSLLNRRIVLINNNNGRNLVVLMKHCRQIQQCRRQLYLTSLTGSQLLIDPPAVLIALVISPQLPMTLSFFGKQLTNSYKRLLPSIKFYVFESQEDHRVFPLIIPILLSTSPYLLIPEVNRSILIALLKKSTQHIHVESFAKAPRTREKRYHRAFINKILDHHRFINIVVFRRCQAIFGYANGQRKLRQAFCFAICSRLDSLIFRFLRVIRN